MKLVDRGLLVSAAEIDNYQKSAKNNHAAAEKIQNISDQG